MDQAAIIAGIRALARARGGIDGMEVTALRKLQGGNSSEIWAFDGSWSADASEAVEQPLILRSGMENEFGFGGRSAEFEVLKALAGKGLPAPQVYWFDAKGTFFDRPAMVMDRCPGASDRNLMSSRNKLGLTEADRIDIGGQMMGLLAKLHDIDCMAVPGAANWMTAEQHLRQHDDAIARFEVEPMVELRYASWWLWRHLPAAPARPSIVHGDFRPANLLVEGRNVSAVLDWEFTHVGDPAEDLGWFLSPYYASEHLIVGSFDLDKAISLYERSRRAPVDRAAVRFWSVFAMYKLAYMTVAALRWLIDGDASRMAASAEFIIGPLLTAIARPVTDTEIAA